MPHPPLTKTQRDVLFTVRYEHRDAPWHHNTLNYLRALGLVRNESILTATGRPSVAICRWIITPLGVAVHATRPGTPVSDVQVPA